MASESCPDQLRPQRAQPLVQVPENERQRRIRDGVDRGKQGVELRASLPDPKPEVGDHDAATESVHFQVGVDGAARLAASDAEIHQSDTIGRAPAEQRVAASRSRVARKRPGDRVQAARARELSQLIRYSGGARRDLLEPDEVRAEFTDDRTDPLDILAPVDADAAMDVVGGDDQRLTSSP
jgi:hypothetical protein